jgi:hypothetical protein
MCILWKIDNFDMQWCMHIFMGFFHIPLRCLTEESLPERNHFPKKLFTSIYYMYINLLMPK